MSIKITVRVLTLLGLGLFLTACGIGIENNHSRETKIGECPKIAQLAPLNSCHTTTYCKYWVRPNFINKVLTKLSEISDSEGTKLSERIYLKSEIGLTSEATLRSNFHLQRDDFLVIGFLDLQNYWVLSGVFSKKALFSYGILFTDRGIILRGRDSGTFVSWKCLEQEAKFSYKTEVDYKYLEIRINQEYSNFL